MRNRDRADGGRIAERLHRFGEFVVDESPLYSRICLALGDDPTVTRILSAAPYDQPPANIILAGVQFLLLSGQEHPLATHYPSLAGERDLEGDPIEQFREFVEVNEAALTGIAETRRVQTNEVRRCVGVLPALVTAFTDANTPLALIEIGASAGLNLRFDRYRYEYADRGAGPVSAPVVLNTELRGAPPPIDPFPAVAWKRGLDLEPLDPGDADAVRWARALLWPEQSERIDRFERAISAAAADEVVVVRGDGVDDLPALVAEAPDDAAIVVLHTFVLNQFTPERRAELTETITRLAMNRPIRRIGIDMLSRGAEAPPIRLTSYGTARDGDRVLGTMHHHGAWLDWAE